ncbi:MAG TPA: alkaline phosphatase [Clostridiales bacterium]|nr:MAG: Alkaline phosphatase precursor [Firmicutes bacterium ADurb.Bin262]HOU10792.1 alkaline phosphatase [Clostridiales bacterium]HQK73995.1 alkaline phosphatase [Clostridiales bacterium]
MDFLLALFKKSLVFKGYAAVITAAMMLVSLFAGLLPAPAPRDEAQNIIFIIGDGMGENHLALAKQELGLSLVMETMPLRGQSETRSSSAAVTDSGAGATALSCGVRTTNGCVGVYPYDPYDFISHPENLTELAMEKGMSTGIVTTDSTAGATPAGFSAHTSSRDNTADISRQQAASGIDLIWGAACSDITPELVEGFGYDYIASDAELASLTPGQKSFGQFNGDQLWKSEPAAGTPSLTEMAGKAIGLLDSDEDGFFLMIEGAHIDKNSHSNKVAETVACVAELDKTVAAALDFARADGNTLVIVTADHETGAIQYINGKYAFTSGSHSSANVPLFVYGSSNFIENGAVVKNKDIALFTAMTMGFGPDVFPSKIAA